MNTRKFIFYLIDRLKGGRVYSHINSIKYQQGNNEYQLQNLLNHAISTTLFYKDLDISDIKEFPVINKTIIKQNFNEFKSNNFSETDQIKVTTSGSTGTPFTVCQDRNKKDRNTADTIVFAQKAGYHIGQKLYYLKIWSAANHKSSKTKFFQNISTIDVLLLDENRIQKLLNEWKKQRSPFGIIGYASALETICKYCKTKQISKVVTKVNSIVTISESLDPNVKVELSKIFGVKVVSRYSNVENGIIAQQETNEELSFIVNQASYYLEIFELERDIPAPLGEEGRIILTDLYNYGMPLIRYDTGDIGSVFIVKGVQHLKNLHGRKLDTLYNTKGHVVNSLLVYRNMWQYTELIQYQLIQKGKVNYTVKVTCNNGFEKADKLKKEFKEYLGSDAIINIQIVNEIPLLSSGKRRKVVQEYYK